MEQKGLTRVFSDEGVIAKKIIQRYAYDYEKIKSILSPLGKWEEILKADDARLKHLLKQVPHEIRLAIEEARSVERQYAVLTASEKKFLPNVPPVSLPESSHSDREK